MLNGGCKCSSKCPLTDDFTPLRPTAPPTRLDYRSYQWHCLEMKPCEAQGTAVFAPWTHRLLELGGPGVIWPAPRLLGSVLRSVSRNSMGSW